MEVLKFPMIVALLGKGGAVGAGKLMDGVRIAGAPIEEGGGESDGWRSCRLVMGGNPAGGTRFESPATGPEAEAGLKAVLLSRESPTEGCGGEREPPESVPSDGRLPKEAPVGERPRV